MKHKKKNAGSKHRMPAPLVSSNVCKLKLHNLHPCSDLNNNDALPPGTMFTL